jgi:hypothetical protein
MSPSLKPEAWSLSLSWVWLCIENNSLRHSTVLDCALRQLLICTAAAASARSRSREIKHHANLSGCRPQASSFGNGLFYIRSGVLYSTAWSLQVDEALFSWFRDRHRVPPIYEHIDKSILTIQNVNLLKKGEAVTIGMYFFWSPLLLLLIIMTFSPIL